MHKYEMNKLYLPKEVLKVRTFIRFSKYYVT